MESGISGYLLKNTGFSDLKAGITKVSDGGFTFSPEVMEIIVNRFNVKPEAKRSGQSAGGALLSAREIELIKLIGEELTMREIAQKLFISEHTVKTHRKNIMAKMEVKNTAGLMKKAFILGLIQ
jgi:DNA-binding NarL/FixJ family response regulator